MDRPNSIGTSADYSMVARRLVSTWKAMVGVMRRIVSSISYTCGWTLRRTLISVPSVGPRPFASVRSHDLFVSCGWTPSTCKSAMFEPTFRLRGMSIRVASCSSRLHRRSRLTKRWNCTSIVRQSRGGAFIFARRKWDMLQATRRCGRKGKRTRLGSGFPVSIIRMNDRPRK